MRLTKEIVRIKNKEFRSQLRKLLRMEPHEVRELLSNVDYEIDIPKSIEDCRYILIMREFNRNFPNWSLENE